MPRSRYSHSAFINCPFDPDFDALFRAIVFAVQDCGFAARCALEQQGATETRIEKLYQIISECQYGIHDISRTGPDETTRLPRFNMPLELGIFLGAKKFGSSQQKKKQCLILDRDKFRYQQFCSDISGHDVRQHGNSPARVVRVVRDWLRSTTDEVKLPSGTEIFQRYVTFSEDLPLYCRSLRLAPEELTFNDFTTLVEEWLRANSW